MIFLPPLFLFFYNQNQERLISPKHTWEVANCHPPSTNIIIIIITGNKFMVIIMMMMIMMAQVGRSANAIVICNQLLPLTLMNDSETGPPQTPCDDNDDYFEDCSIRTTNDYK